ncbi:MAG: hypothetical protein ABI921_09560, partial [Panacibacter sp.]
MDRSDYIKKEIIFSLEVFIDDLTSLCESEIEKQVLLSLLKYILCDKFSIKADPYIGIISPKDFIEWQFTDIDRINDIQESLFMSNEEVAYSKQKGYKFYGMDLIKTIGIKFKDEHDFEPNTYTNYKLIPQY